MSDDRLRVRSRDEAQRDIAVKALQQALGLIENMPVVQAFRVYEVVRVALDSIETIGAGPAL